jgi:CRISPR-associated protein Csb1
MSDIENIYEKLVAGVAGDGEVAGIRSTSTCQPSGGPGTRVMPPTYPGGYITEERVIDGTVEKVVQLDSYQAQANRVEEALLEARDDGRIELPLFEMNVAIDPWHLRLTSYDLPHRYADAYLRDSTIDGTRFDKTDIGKALRTAEPRDASALLRYDPGSLVFGAWNSHRSGRQPKFSRSYRSEVLGIGYEESRRKGGRLDPINLTGAVDDTAKREGDWKFVIGEKAKGKKLSEIGHGNALSGEDAPGGVTVREAKRLGFISFGQVARLRFGGAEREAVLAARAAVVALALAGDRLAFDRAGLVFRSGCELTVTADELAWEMRGGEVEPLELDATGAIDLFHLARDRSNAAGLEVSGQTIAIEPIDSLREAIEHAFLTADPGEG